MMSYHQWRLLLREQKLPVVVVNLDAFDRNINELARFLQPTSKTLRLATKSVRVPDLIARVLKANPLFSGLMCYSAEEAELLFEQGFDDLLVAYPTLQKTDLAALRRVHEKGGKVRLVVDSEVALRAVAGAMASVSVGTSGSSRRPFEVLIDVDMSWRGLGGLFYIGVRRSPVRSDADLRALLEVAKTLSTVKVVGAMGYEAQVAGLGDRNPFKRWMNPVARVVRRLSMRSVRVRRERVARVFEEAGVHLEVFNGGGTGSVNYAVDEPWLTELSAGSALLCPHLFDYYSNVRFEPACFFALQVVRSSDEGYVTCQGGGYIASGEPGWDRVPLPYLPEGARLVAMEGAGEVQTPVRLPSSALRGDEAVRLGDPILFRHAKAGELAESFSEYLLVSGGKLVGKAKTYRGLGACFF